MAGVVEIVLLYPISLCLDSVLSYNSIDLDYTTISYLYNGCFTTTNVVLFIQFVLYIVSGILCHIWAPSTISINGYNIPVIREHTLVVLFTLLGGIILISSTSILSLFLSLELQSLSLYVIATLYRQSESSTSAGLKYLILGGFSSAIILLGTALVYTSLGTLNYIDIGIILQSYNTTNASIFGITLIILGLLFKLSSAPLHNWAPDVYDGTPTVITIWLTVIPKISLFLAIYNVASIFSNNTWLIAVLFGSLCSLIIGTVLGVTSIRIKRLLTFSTISHVGYILLAISINTIEAFSAFIFYLVQYTVANATLFSLLLGIGYFNQVYYKTIGDLEVIDSISGLSKVNPVLAISIAVTLFSIAGIPPIFGFFAKMNVLYSAISIGYYLIAVVAVFTSVISAYYYLKLISTIFFSDTILKSNIINTSTSSSYINNISINTVHSIILSLGILIITGYLLFPSLLLDVSTLLALTDYTV